MTRRSAEGEHYVTVPLHSPLRVGTLSAVHGEVAVHRGMSKAEVIGRVT